MVGSFLQLCLLLATSGTVSAFAPVPGRLFRSHTLSMVIKKDITMPRGGGSSRKEQSSW